VPRDIFEEAPPQAFAKFADDPFDVWPQVPFVVFAFSLTCVAEWLAGVSGKQCIDCAGEGLGVECCDVIPDWCGREVSGPLCCDEGLSGVFFPFDKTSCVKVGFCEHKAHIKASGSCAE
jgi:hypothetical protein